jgi:hypothetical protein
LVSSDELSTCPTLQAGGIGWEQHDRPKKVGDGMNAKELLRQYVELAKWETETATPAGIVADAERYPEPWRQRREFFDCHWQAGDAAEVTRGGQVMQDESLGWRILAVETDAGIVITDDCNGDGYFRIGKRPKIDRAERLVTMLAGGLRPGGCLEVHSRGNHLGRIKVTTASEFMAEWGNAVAYPWHDTSLANDPYTKGRFLGIVYEEGSTLIRLDVPSDWSGFTSAKASRQRLGAARHRCLAATER